jgi:hypothetical protein
MPTWTKVKNIESPHLHNNIGYYVRTHAGQESFKSFSTKEAREEWDIMGLKQSQIPRCVLPDEPSEWILPKLPERRITKDRTSIP